MPAFKQKNALTHMPILVTIPKLLWVNIPSMYGPKP